jgi:PAS domain S-box-containing protein
MWNLPYFSQRSAPRRYSLAIAFSVVALSLGILLEPIAGPDLGFLVVAMAILMAGRVGGLGPSLAAALLGVIFGWYLLLEPRASFAITKQQDMFGLAAFALATLVMSVLGSQFHRSMRITTLSEERLRLAIETAHIGIGDIDFETQRVVYNQEGYRILGRPVDSIKSIPEVLGILHPDDLERVKAVIAHQTDPAGDGHALDEVRVIRPDGETRWVAFNSQTIFRSTANGRLPVRGISAFMDITERKLDQDRLRALTRELLTAQEAERARIGRELHDDVTQQLMVLGLGIEMARSDQDPASRDNRLRAIHDKLADLTERVRNLSHEYHAGNLEIVSLPMALQSYCREFSQNSGIPTQFSTRDLPASISREISIVMFRSAQEALHNVLKHSGATNVTVLLSGIQLDTGTPGLSLTVIDNGQGFLVEEIRNGSGLGLLSIEERARHVRGSLSLSSVPQEGTRLQVIVPIQEAE